jgi:hypothetical protein
MKPIGQFTRQAKTPLVTRTAVPLLEKNLLAQGCLSTSCMPSANDGAHCHREVQNRWWPEGIGFAKQRAFQRFPQYGFAWGKLRAPSFEPYCASFVQAKVKHFNCDYLMLVYGNCWGFCYN